MMRFRYLIAVPFTSHGSAIRDMEVRLAGRWQQVQVTPVVPIAALDFALLRPAFERSPSLIGLPDASFHLEGDTIFYEGFPGVDEFKQLVGRIVIDQWLGRRSSAITVVYRALERLHAAMEISETEVVSKELLSFYATIPQILCPILISVVVDEPVLERYVLLDSLLADEVRLAAMSTTFQSPFTERWAEQPIGLSQHKRVVPRWSGGSYLATPQASSLDDPIRSRMDFFSAMGHLGVQEQITAELWVIHLMVQCSEELHYLWGSVATLLSDALNTVLDMNTESHVNSEATLISAESFLDSLTNPTLRR